MLYLDKPVIIYTMSARTAQLVILKRRQKAHTVLSTLVFSCIWKRCRQRSFLFSWGRIIYLVFDLGEECIWLKIEQPTRLVIQARLFFTVILRANFSQQKQMSNKLHTSVPTRWAEFANLNPLLFSPNFLDTWTNGKNSFFSVCLNAFNKNYHNNRNTVCELEEKKSRNDGLTHLIWSGRSPIYVGSYT